MKKQVKKAKSKAKRVHQDVARSNDLKKKDLYRSEDYLEQIRHRSAKFNRHGNEV